MRAAAVASGAAALQGLFLTHLHSDHITDLNDVFTMRWVTSFAPSPLSVFGPPGTASTLEAVEAMLAPDIGYRLGHHDDLTWRPSAEVAENTQGVVFERAAVRVTAAATDHSPVRPTVGYRIDDADHSVVIAGDTVPCAGLDELCRDADVLVQTVVRRDLIEMIGLPRLTDVLDYHSSVPQAAETAVRNGVGTLVLTHLVPPPAAGTERDWLDQTERFHGEVVLAHDLLTLDLGAGSAALSG